MDLKKNKSGFTLIELLAVIVILSIIILIASSNIGGMMTTARKNALAVEGDSLANTAKSAYQMEILNGNIGSEKACFSLQYLYLTGLFSKGEKNPNGKEEYSGSVLVTPDDNKVQFTYTVWISNKNYSISGAKLGEISGSSATASTTAASETCGNAAGLTYFNATADATGKVTTSVAKK